MFKKSVLSVAGAVLGGSLLYGAFGDAKSSPSIWLTSELLGMKVVSQDGTGLGKIEDVVVHPGSKSAYAVMSFGDWHGIGGKLFAMPWTVLRTIELDSSKKDSARSLVLPLERDRLKTAPGFDKAKWPSFANPEWTKDVDAFYVGDMNPNLQAKPIEAGTRLASHTWRTSELKGTNVLTPDGATLGDIRELAIDSSGRVVYATLSVGGFLGIGDRVTAVPWDLFKFALGGAKADKELITLAVTKKQLELAPEFSSSKERCAEMCDPLWAQRVYEHFSCPIYWERAGGFKAGAGAGAGSSK